MRSTTLQKKSNVVKTVVIQFNIAQSFVLNNHGKNGQCAPDCLADEASNGLFMHKQIFVFDINCSSILCSTKSLSRGSDGIHEGTLFQQLLDSILLLFFISDDLTVTFKDTQVVGVCWVFWQSGMKLYS